MFHPPPAVPEQPEREWIELHNSGTNTVDLTGWRLQKGISFSFTNASIPPGGYLVVAANQATFGALHPMTTNVVGNWTGKLRNNGDEIELQDQVGQKVDTVSYSTEGDWALRRKGDAYPGKPDWWAGWKWESAADGVGRSLELIDSQQPNSYGESWTASLLDGGTPGRPNSAATNRPAPFILNVRHLPAIPRSTNTVTVSARIVTGQGLTPSVTVHYRVDGVSAFGSALMLDDGLNGDGLPGDGIFGAKLPAQPDKTVVEFYVQASDSQGRNRTWPAATDDVGSQGANALYQVDNLGYSGSQPIYRFIVKSEEWNSWVNLMDNVSGGQFSDAQMNGALVRVDSAGTDVRYCVGIRNRGAGTRAAKPHNLHLSIPLDDPMGGISRLDFNTRIVHSQVAGNALFSSAGLLNAYGAPVQVRVNANNLANASPNGSTDSFQFGSYYCFQPYDSEWAKAHIPQDSSGNLYKGVWYQDTVRLTHEADLSYLGTNVASYRLAYSPTGPTADSGPYDKGSNKAEDDWSDLINLTYVLSTNTLDSNYISSLTNVLDVEQWLRHIAAHSLLINMETTLATGDGDDYTAYRGTLDPRFQLLPHDLDTILAQGDAQPSWNRSIFKGAELAVLNRLLKHPEIAPRYFAQLKQLAETSFADANIGPLLDQVLGGWVPASYIDSMRSAASTRRTNVLNQIPQTLTVSNSLPIVSGYPRSTSTITSLSGSANAIHTRSILVNGSPSSYVPWQGTWSASSVTLRPGINSILVQSFDENGQESSRATISIWYDDSSLQVAGGTIASDTTWTAAAGPYNVTSSLTVSAGVTLTIEPGTTVYLAAGVNFTVANGGRLLAEGTPNAPIMFTQLPGATTPWGGVTINGAAGSPETRIDYATFQGNGTTCIEAAAGTLYLGHTKFLTTNKQYLSLDGASFLVEDCYFPTPSAQFELVHGTLGIKTGGRGIIQRCFFGKASGYNDVIDFTGGNRDSAQPIFQCYDNVFTGSGDDELDLDGTDAWIEGNIFLNVHKNGSPDSSSAVSGGSDGARTSELTIVRNLFFDCDQAATAKQGNFYSLINNTIVRITNAGGLDSEFGVVNLKDLDPTPTTSGVGCYLEGNIIVDSQQLVRNYSAAQAVVTFTNNLMPVAWNGPGGNNTTNDPMLQYIPSPAETQFKSWEEAQIVWKWFGLRSGSPAQGAGPGGHDAGGVIPTGVSISGEPSELTGSRNATLSVGFVRTGSGIPVAGFPEGSGYTHYKWRLDGGSWSGETSITSAIVLANLSDGQHYVEASGKRDSGIYQDAAELAPNNASSRSRTWKVDTTSRRIWINEILADNQGAVPVNDTTPDMIELFNPGASPVQLDGMAISDDASNPSKYVFPAGSAIPAGGYLVLIADKNPGANHTGFALENRGGGVYLFDTIPNQRVVLDSIVYGNQLANLSVGRTAAEGWKLMRPSLGSVNTAIETGAPDSLFINEWLAASAGIPEFIELFNPEPVAVNVGGCYLTDNIAGYATKSPVPPLTFIPAGGFLVFLPDGQTNFGHVNFKLGAEWGAVGLFSPQVTLIDQVLYGPQTRDISMGRTPNGAPTIAFFNVPTPGTGNPATLGDYTVTNITLNLMSFDKVWKYNQTANLDGSTWTATIYDDAAWPQGPGLLAFETAPAITPLIKTTLADPRTPPAGLSPGHAYYFRAALDVTNDLSGFVLKASMRLDDGAVVYINGAEVQRIRMAAGVAITNLSWATGLPGSGDATADELLTFPGSLLKKGLNVIAVEVHQVTNSSDIVWGLALEAFRSVTNWNHNQILLSEILANNRSLTNADGTLCDWVELHNPGASPADLSGFILRGNPSKSGLHEWKFPTGITLVPGGYLIVRCDPASPASTNISAFLNTGFGIDSDGDKLMLYKGASLVDAVSFGAQAQDFSLSRMPETQSWALSLPTPGEGPIVASLGDPSGLRFNEWMADPKSGDDWFELYNSNPQPVALGGLCLTDDLNRPTQFSIPPLSFIGSGFYGAFSVFLADLNPTNGPTHTNFKLSAGGESLGLFSADGATRFNAVTFRAQAKGVSEGFFPEGSDNLQRFLRSETPGSPNYIAYRDVTISELLPRPSSGGQLLELFNQSEQTVDLSGSWLSDDVQNPKKFRLSDPTILPPGTFIVVAESEFNPIPGVDPSFSLDPVQGGKVFLSLSTLDGTLTGYRTSTEFGAADPGVALGLYEASTGPECVAMTSTTFGAPNAVPAVGPIVINEIHYHPPDVGTNDNTVDEFIELLNVTSTAVSLWDPNLPTNTWHLRNAVSYNFPPGTSVPGAGKILLVSFDPVLNATVATAFRQKFAVPATVPMFGPWNGKLSNGGDTIELNRSSAPVNGLIPRVIVDRIKFRDQAPWPTAADGFGTGTGYSLQRVQGAAFGNDPVNWVTAAPTGGADNTSSAGVSPTITAQPLSTVLPAGGTANFTAAADVGSPPLYFQWRLDGFDLLEATNSILSLANVSYADAGRYSLRVSNPFGCVVSTNAFLRIQAAPIISRQPDGGTAEGGPFSFYVVARGTAPLSYQWKLDGQNIPGATGAIYTISAPTQVHAGNYSVLISNTYGNVLSDIAVLTADVADSDQDGIPDAWTLQYFGHPTGQPEDESLATDDPDGDGMDNLSEYRAGTHPRLASSMLYLTVQGFTVNQDLVMAFEAAPNHSYTVERRTSLDVEWSTFMTVPPSSTPRTIQFVDQPAAYGQGFYRVVTAPE